MPLRRFNYTKLFCKLFIFTYSRIQYKHASPYFLFPYRMWLLCPFSDWALAWMHRLTHFFGDIRHLTQKLDLRQHRCSTETTASQISWQDSCRTDCTLMSFASEKSIWLYNGTSYLLWQRGVEKIVRKTISYYDPCFFVLFTLLS